MNMNRKMTGIVIATCMSLSVLASCNTSPATSTLPTANNTNVQTSANSNATVQQSALTQQAQLALANYHEVDASFYDTVQLANQGGFRTQLLGIDVVDDLVNDVTDAVDPDDNDTDSESSASTDVGANAGVNANIGIDTGDDGINADIGADATVDASANTSNSSSDAAAATGVNAGIDTNVGVNAGDAINANVGANTNASVTGDIITSDTSSLLTEMESDTERLSTDIIANGSVSIDANGDSTIDADQLRMNVDTMIGGSAEANILENLDLSSDAVANAMTRLDERALLRLEGRGFSALGGELQSQSNEDGTVTNVFGLQLTGNGTERSIISANRLQNETNLGIDLMLRENGNGFIREANRMSRITAQGNLRVVTRTTTDLTNGGQIEIFEERITDVRGNGVGNGVITLTDAEGNAERFDFNTLVRADGSLISNLNLANANDNNISGLVLREDASGNASLSFLGNTNEEERRLDLDFNAMLDAMGDARIA